MKISKIVLSICIISVLLFGNEISFSQSSTDYIITKRFLSIEDGLSSHEVFCGLQDKQGFIWFGTRNGLDRYDGKNFLHFTRQRNNLQENKVVQVAKDDANNMFIEYGSTGFQLATNGKVDVMNLTTHEVKSLTATFPKLPFKEKDVYWISNDGTDVLYFLTAYPFRLWKYSSVNGFKLRYEIKDWHINNEDPKLDYRTSGLNCVFQNGKVLLRLSEKDMHYLVTEDTVVNYSHPRLGTHPLAFTSNSDLLFIYVADENNYKIGKVSPKGEVEIPADAKKYHLEIIDGKRWNTMVCSAQDYSCLFYGEYNGLYFWNENTILKIFSDVDIKGFENLFLYSFFSDNFGNKWICTSLGILQVKIEKNCFRHFFTTQQQSIEKNNQARGIFAEDSGKVLANIWTSIFAQTENKTNAVTTAEIKYALIKHKNEFYCGGFSLYRYDIKQNSLNKIPGGTGSEIWSMLSLNDSLVVLGRTNGFSLFNSNINKFDTMSYVSGNVREAKFVYRFLKSNDTIWAVAENGLFELTMDNGQLTIGNRQSSIVNNMSLLDAYIDDDGIFWLATNGEGLYGWDRKTNNLQQFNIVSGFPSDVLYRIETDDYGNLWISSDNGLIRFNKKTFSAETYTTTNGITHNEFNRTSSFKANDGQLFFGGLDGVNAFYPKDFISDTNSFNVPLRIISFNLFMGSKNKLVNKTNELLNTSQITLQPNDKFFTLEFQLLDFAKEDVHRYAYLIDGVDKEWNYIDENNIRISGLAYGNYTLHIKGQNHEGAWSKNELSIPIIVLKPFYLKWWFIALVVFVFVLVIYFVIHSRTKKLAADKIKLEQTVTERTAQLQQSLSKQYELLNEKDILMKEIHHRVKNNLQVISGLLELQSKNLVDETAKDALREGRNRVRSIALIHQNLYQFENLSSIELNRFANDLCNQVQSVFQKPHVAIKIEVPPMNLDIDTAVPLGLIMNELLTNSFKYAFNSVQDGQIYLKVNLITEGKYELIYSDNGPGLAEGFDTTKSKTLGMQLIHDLSRQIGGTVKYEYKNGPVFIINFTNRETRKNED
ncbi:MAG: histidine kinase dimerization/phosphoacceptor domain -containing protein [Bacteroidia bacterium]